MWHRTVYESCTDWVYYGGKGIRVEEDGWKDFAVFLDALGPKPEPKHLYSLARRDKSLGYFGENVFWANGPDRGPGKFQTHCKRGHLLAGDNLLPCSLKLGKRRCRACVNLRYAPRKKKKETVEV